MPPSDLSSLAARVTGTLSDRELLLAGSLVVALLYLAVQTVRSGRPRDRQGRLRSRRRAQFLGLIKVGVVVGVLWLAASLGGLL